MRRIARLAVSDLEVSFGSRRVVSIDDLRLDRAEILGLGAQDPVPDWGLMVSEGQRYFTPDWWLVTFPGLVILMTAFAFNLLGDGLRDLLDPKRSFLL